MPRAKGVDTGKHAPRLPIGKSTSARFDNATAHVGIQMRGTAKSVEVGFGDTEVGASSNPTASITSNGGSRFATHEQDLRGQVPRSVRATSDDVQIVVLEPERITINRECHVFISMTSGDRSLFWNVEKNPLIAYSKSDLIHLYARGKCDLWSATRLVAALDGKE